MRRIAIALALGAFAFGATGCPGDAEDQADALMKQCQDDVQNGTESGACDRITKILDEN